MKKLYVLFHNNDAVLYNNQKPSKIGKSDVILENPDLQRVVGISPHYWKLVGDQIFPMNQAEITIKHATHAKHYRKFNAVQWRVIGERVFWSVFFFATGSGLVYYLMRNGVIK